MYDEFEILSSNLKEELQKGLDDMNKGHVYYIDEVFDELDKEILAVDLDKSKKQYKDGKIHNARTAFNNLRKKYEY